MWFISLSEDDTKRIAYNIAKKKRKCGLIVCLNGDLGAGKTIFVKEFAKGLDIKDYIFSPTFGIVNEYHGEINLYHFDVYRITSIDDLDYVCMDDYFCSPGICIIEWANLIKDVIPKDALWINIYKNLSYGNNYRLIKTTIDQ